MGLSLGLIILGGSAVVIGLQHLPNSEKKLVVNWLILGGSGGFLMLGLELFTNGVLIRNIFELLEKPLSSYQISNLLSPGIAAITLLLWPWAFLTYKNHSPLVSIPLILTGLIIINLSNNDVAIFSLMAGIVFALSVIVLRGKLFITIVCVISIFVVSFPKALEFVPDPKEIGSGPYLKILSNSAIHRLNIWKRTAEHINDRKFFGHGFNSSRAMYGSETKVSNVYLPDVPERVFTNMSEPIPLHPHNLVLQIWLELGLLGALILIIFLSLIVRACNSSQLTVPEKAICLGHLGSAFAVSNVSFSAWQGWWLSTLILSATLTILATKTRKAT